MELTWQGDAEMSSRLLRANDAAGELGISVSWLRRAEKRGHIPPAKRDLNGWRVYTEADVALLREKFFPVTTLIPESSDISNDSEE